MSNQALSKQLIERIFSNVGLTKIGAGLTVKENLLDKKLKLQEENSKIKEYPVYAGQCVASDIPIEAIACNIGDDEHPDFILVLKQNNLILALRYSWEENDYGLFMTRDQNKWVDIPVLHQLNLTSATEMIAQNGIPWIVSSQPSVLFGILTLVLSENE